MYGLIQGLAMVAYIVAFIFYGKNYGYSKLKSLFLGVTAVMVCYVAIILLTWIENGFEKFGAQNAVRVFVFCPLFIYIVSNIVNTDFRKYLDFNAFPAMLWYGLGHLACLTAGCCNGFRYYEGTPMYRIANALTGTNMLPTQWIESLAALLTAGVIFYISKKKNFQTKGYTYYIMLILYGTQRFIFEFFRENRKLIVFAPLNSADGDFGISNLAIWAAAMAVEGALLLALSVRKDRKTGIAE